MTQKYPMIKPWLEYRQVSGCAFEVENTISLEEKNPVRLPFTLVRFMQKLDGKTNPYTIDPFIDSKRVKTYLRFLSKHGYLREKTRNRDVGKYAFSVVKYDGKPRDSYSSIVINRLLLFLWLPVFIAGMLLTYIMLDTTDALSNNTYYWGTLFGLLVGLSLHEGGHAVAAKAYKAPVYELGFRLSLLPAAYCLIKETVVKNRLKRTQIYAAGVETNLMLAGLLGFLAFGCKQNAMLRSFFFYAALENVLLAIANLCFFLPLDGFKIAAALIGADDLASSMISALIIPRIWKKEFKRGVQGLTRILCVVYMLLAQSIAIIWILFTVGEIIS